MTVTTAPHARGRICYRRRKIVSQVLAGQRVGVNQVDDYLGSSPSCTTISGTSTMRRYDH